MDIYHGAFKDLGSTDSATQSFIRREKIQKISQNEPTAMWCFIFMWVLYLVAAEAV